VKGCAGLLIGRQRAVDNDGMSILTCPTQGFHRVLHAIVEVKASRPSLVLSARFQLINLVLGRTLAYWYQFASAQRPDRINRTLDTERKLFVKRRPRPRWVMARDSHMLLQGYARADRNRSRVQRRDGRRQWRRATVWIVVSPRTSTGRSWKIPGLRRSATSFLKPATFFG
jgi:hypothetical protein